MEDGERSASTSGTVAEQHDSSRAYASSEDSEVVEGFLGGKSPPKKKGKTNGNDGKAPSASDYAARTKVMEQIVEQNGAVGRPVASQDVELQRIALERHKLNFEIYKYALDKDLDFRALCDEIKRA